MEDKALGLLGLMRRARALEAGTDNACQAVREGKAKLLIFSADITENARRKAENAAEGRRVLVLPVHYSRFDLASALGLGECSMAAVTELGFASTFVKILAETRPDAYQPAAEELARRNEKAVRRKKEKPQRADSKRNGKRRSEV